MDFARARTQEQVISRQEEILNACDTLFSKYGYDGVNFMAISAMTSITRPSIYNYYKTKDEILLDLLKREILSWQASLNEVIDIKSTMTKEQFSAYLTESLSGRWKMGELISLEYPVLQRNCSENKLADFRTIIEQFNGTLAKSLDKYFPAASLENKAIFIKVLTAFLRGFYPTAYQQPKEWKATQKSEVDDPVQDYEQTCYQGILLLLSDL